MTLCFSSYILLSVYKRLLYLFRILLTPPLSEVFSFPIRKRVFQNYLVMLFLVCQILFLFLWQRQYPEPVFSLYFHAHSVLQMKVPIKSFPFRVSSKGISSTHISIPFSLVRILHCSCISR